MMEILNFNNLLPFPITPSLSLSLTHNHFHISISKHCFYVVNASFSFFNWPILHTPRQTHTQDLSRLWQWRVFSLSFLISASFSSRSFKWLHLWHREAKKMSEGNFCAFFFFAISRCCLCGRVVEALHKKKQPTILFMVSFITRTCRVRCMHQSGNNLCWMKWKFPLIKFSPSSDSESERVTRCIS